MNPIELIDDDDATVLIWSHGVAWEWANELSDAQQDLYTLADGQPVDAAR